jgi:outer membrane protein OmpA-like peptidoglycan-associated protein
MKRLIFLSVLLSCLPAVAAEGQQKVEGESPDSADSNNVQELSDEEQAAVLLDKDDPQAQQGEVVGSRGIDPGWNDSRVAERSPNMYGQNGLRRLTSARANKSGYLDFGLHTRSFYSENFIADGADTNVYLWGIGTFGFSVYDIVEIALATSFASNENSVAEPRTTFSTGDFLPSIKVDITEIPAKFGLNLMPLALGLDIRMLFPPQQDAVGADLGNFSITNSLLFSLDFYEAWDIPMRLHMNGGYVYQNAHYFYTNDRDKAQFFFQGVSGHLLALTSNQWFYDQVFAGIGAEFPLPYVTPFLEFWWQSAILVPSGYGANGGDYDYLTDPHSILTPGLRVSFGRGLHIDLAADVGLTGTGGYLTPKVNNLVDGQPINPVWAVQAAISYTFSPFVAETQVEVRERKIALGRVNGCVVNDETDKPIEEAYIEFMGTAGPRIVVNDEGCFESPEFVPGEMVIKVKHPDYKSDELSIQIIGNETATAKSRLAPAPRYGRFKGIITNEDDVPVDGILEISVDDEVVMSQPSDGGAFDFQMEPGRFQVIVKAEGYLQQGAPLLIEPLGKTIRNFILKEIPKTRISILKKDKIEITTKIPFEYNKARLLRAAEFVLDDVVDVILQNPQIDLIQIEGHTDNTGEAKYNEELSRSRAETVMEYLIEKGVPESRLEAIGYGFKRPLAGNDTEEGRAQNRRVEFMIAGQAVGDNSDSEDAALDDEPSDGEDPFESTAGDE